MYSSDEMLAEYNNCMRECLSYLGTKEVVLGERARGKKGIKEIIKLQFWAGKLLIIIISVYNY